jgi:hypothetical protein
MGFSPLLSIVPYYVVRVANTRRKPRSLCCQWLGEQPTKVKHSKETAGRIQGEGLGSDRGSVLLLLWLLVIAAANGRRTRYVTMAWAGANAKRMRGRGRAPNTDEGAKRMRRSDPAGTMLRGEGKTGVYPEIDHPSKSRGKLSRVLPRMARPCPWLQSPACTYRRTKPAQCIPIG